MTQSAAERYLRLGLQLGRHVEGMVDAYFGPPELAAAVEAAPPVEPRKLVAAAEGLLDELEDGWLRDQVVGLRTYAGVLAGESVSYADEVEGCYGMRPTYTDEAVFTAAHERLERSLERLRELGVTAEGEVGDADPLQAIEDGLRTFGADEVIISTHPEGRSVWLEKGVVRAARERFDVPITHVVVDLEAEAEAETEATSA